MTSNDFSERLIRRFPAMTKMEAVVSDIENLTNSLADTDLDKLWIEFVNNYDKSTPPMRAHIYKMCQLLGLRQKSGPDNFTAMYRCDCGGIFHPDNMRCPKCKTRDMSKWFVFRMTGATDDQIEAMRVV